MKRRLGFLLAVAAMLPGIAVTAHAEPVAEECFARTSDLGNIPTISSASATCDAPAGRFDLSAEWVTPADGLGPSFGGARSTVDFYREIDPTGLSAFDVVVTLHVESARALARTTAIGGIVDGGQSAGANVELELPECSGCTSIAGQAYGSIVSTRQGEVAVADETKTYVLPVRRRTSMPMTGPVLLRVSIDGFVNGIYTPGRSEAQAAGNIVSISIQPPPPPFPICPTNAYVSAMGASAEGSASVQCDPDARTFATDLRIDNSIGLPYGDSTIDWRETRTFAGGTSFAVLEVPITISEASFHAPGSSTAGLWPDATALISVSYRRPSGFGVNDGFTVIDSTRDEAWVGTRTMRFLIQAPQGEVLEAGDYEIAVSILAELNRSTSSMPRRAQWPGEPLDLSLAGSIGTITLSALSTA